MLHGYRKILSYDVGLISEKIETFIYILLCNSNIKTTFNKKFEKKPRLNPYDFYILGFLCNILEITKKKFNLSAQFGSKFKYAQKQETSS